MLQNLIKVVCNLGNTLLLLSVSLSCKLDLIWFYRTELIVLIWQRIYVVQNLYNSPETKLIKSIQTYFRKPRISCAGLHEMWFATLKNIARKGNRLYWTLTNQFSAVLQSNSLNLGLQFDHQNVDLPNCSNWIEDLCVGNHETMAPRVK